MPYLGLLHQNPCPCGSPLLTCTYTQTPFWLSLCGVSGSWCSQGVFEPSEHLWWVWGLILNAISPLLPSCWGFSFALGRWISPQSHSNATQPPFPCLSSCWGFSALRVGYLLTVTPAPCSRCSGAVTLNNSKYRLLRCLSGKESAFS